MKKLAVITLGILSLLILASCNKGSEPTYDLDDAALKTQIVKDWFGQAEDYESDYLNKAEDTDLTKERIEVYAPKDIVAKARYTVQDMESVFTSDLKTKAIYTSYYSMSPLFVEQTQNYIIDPIKTIADDIKAAFASDLEITINETWKTALDKSLYETLEGGEGKTRVLTTLYVPFFVKYYMPKEGENARHVLTTYVVMPIYNSFDVLATPAEGSSLTLPESHKLYSFGQFNITVKDNVIVSETAE